MLPSPSTSKYAAILLAAGASSRLGQPKQLLKIAGETLLRRTIRLATEAGCWPALVILGSERERMLLEIENLAAFPVVNQDWQEGMGSSMRCGIEALIRVQPGSLASLILVCDQPGLTADHLRNLIRLHEQNEMQITASVYAGTAGVPAIFSAALYPELEKIKGDRGARQIIRHHAAAVQLVEWPAGELDIDCRADLERVPGFNSES